MVWDEFASDAQDPFDIDEYADTHTIQVRQRRTKVIKAPKGLENILYNIYEEINDIKNTVYEFESGYNAGFYIWKYGKYYIATRPYENGKYISYLLYFEPFEIERPENYRFYINGNASTAAIMSRPTRARGLKLIRNAPSRLVHASSPSDCFIRCPLSQTSQREVAGK